MNTSLETLSKAHLLELKRHTACADYYALLQLFLQPPTPETVKSYGNEHISTDFKAIAEELKMDTSLASEIESGFLESHKELAKAENPLSFIRQEYTRLYSHPVAPLIPFYEGTFADSQRVASGKRSSEARLFVNPSAVDAERLYTEAGLTVSSHATIPADSVTTEIEFIGFLHTVIAKAIIDSDDEAASLANQQLEEFCSTHAARWMPHFFERCKEESIVSLYRNVGIMGQALVDLDIEPAAVKCGSQSIKEM